MVRADSLRAVLDSVFAAPEYRWVERPESYALPRRWMRMLQQWLFDLRESHPAAFRLLLAGMILLVIAVFVHAGWVFLRTVRAAGEGAPGVTAAPVPRRDQGWYRREADRLAVLGRYAEAMQYDFLALVLALDASSLVRFHPSKTPGEYSREARLAPAAQDEFRTLVRTLYAYVFARRPCGPREFAEWRALAVPERYAPA
jgi:hypothetical protein